MSNQYAQLPLPGFTTVLTTTPEGHIITIKAISVNRYRLKLVKTPPEKK